MSTSLAVEVENLSHSYAGKRGAPARVALDNLSLTVARGEVFAVLGPNGSGKSTLFNLLCGSMAQSGAGSIRMLGLDPLAQSSALRRQIGVVFQSPALDKKLTCRENLELHGMLFGLGGAALRKQSGQWLERLGLGDRAGDLAESLSGGMRRRLELAKELLPKPELLLMDEPATGLDPSAIRNYWAILLELRREMGLTIVLSTHHMGEADYCDRLAILSAGKCAGTGTPAALKKQIGGQMIAIEPAAGLEPAQLEGMLASALGITPAMAGTRVQFETVDPAGDIARLTALLPGKFRQISVKEPGLDDVFMRLTGKDLGDEESADLKKPAKKSH